MSLPSHIYRHKDDVRIIVGRDINDLLLFKNRSKEEFEGVICPAPLTREQTEAAKHYHQHPPKQHSDGVYFEIFNSWLPCREIDIEKVFRKSLSRRKFDLSLMELPVRLAQLFKEANDNRLTSYLLRRDNRAPTKSHKHQPVLTYEFIGIGTIWENENGQELSAETQAAFLFSEKIVHRAPQQGSRLTLTLT